MPGRFSPEQQAEVDRRVEFWARRWREPRFRVEPRRLTCGRCGSRNLYSERVKDVGLIATCLMCGTEVHADG